MSGWDQTAVTLAVFLPVLGALLIALVPSSEDRLIRSMAVAFTGAALVVGFVMLFGFDYGVRGGLQFEANARWISALGVRYHVGVDGISLPLLELTLLLSFLCAVYSFRTIPSP